MLGGLISVVFWILDFLLGVLLFAVLAFIIAKLAVPENKYVLLAEKYVEIVLVPVRIFVKKIYPPAAEWKLDISPYALFAVILVVRVLLRIIRGILL